MSLSYSIKRCLFFPTSHTFWSGYLLISIHFISLVLYIDIHSKYTFPFDLPFLSSYCCLLRAISYLFYYGLIMAFETQYMCLHLHLNLYQESSFELPIVPIYSILICTMELLWSTWSEILSGDIQKERAPSERRSSSNAHQLQIGRRLWGSLEFIPPPSPLLKYDLCGHEH